MNNQHYYIGLMSGTSLDGVDSVLVKFETGEHPTLIESYSHPISKELKSQLIEASHPDWKGSLLEYGTLHQKLGKLFAQASINLIQKSKVSRKQIIAIGSHGQTLWHQPDGDHPFSLQLGDANIIAELTGITTVADFRSRDIAAGGQGAPLVPAFHKKYLSSINKSRVILNIGGIANITVLPSKSAKISGFDTGPGNTLLDAWIRKNKKLSYDNNGDWAASGKVQYDLLNNLLKTHYFTLPAPKSTGKELFNIAWLEKNTILPLSKYQPQDIQATLNMLTAKSICENIPKSCSEIYICGGGVNNLFLVKTIKEILPKVKIDSTQALNINPDWMEAIAFSWLAKQTIERKPGNLSDVTGANGPRILGAIYPAN